MKTIRINLWTPHRNDGWVWFDRKQTNRFDYGKKGVAVWWCLFGFCGYITLQTWPWQRRAKK